MRFAKFAICAAVGVFVSSSASAVTVICPTGGGGVTISLNVSATCGPSGNGQHIDGNNDPVNKLSPGYTTLDTLHSVGIATLTVSGMSSGSFSFTSPAGWDHFVLAFQTSTASPKPDYFSFLLDNGVTAGLWAILNGGDTVETEAVLYGLDPVATPIPAALPLFASGGGLLGFLSWRRKRKQAA